MQKTISMSALAKDAERIAKDIETRRTLYRVKRSGGRDMMLMDRDYFESWKATIEFVTRHPNWRKELEEADREYAAGKYVPLELVLKELGLDQASSRASRSKATRARSARRRAKTR